MKVALYDMRRPDRPSTYDFFTWLVSVRALGYQAVKVRFADMVSRKWPRRESMERLYNYILPGPALAGMYVASGVHADEVGVIQTHLLPPKWERLQSVLPPKTKYQFTVTLRDTEHNPHKNSNRDVWIKFAEMIGARIIDDYRIERIGLYERVALYAGAWMNYGVPNGPMALLYYTHYPFNIFCDPLTTAKGFSGHGLKVGGQYPFFHAHQRFIWERATLDGLLAAHERNSSWHISQPKVATQ